MATPHFAQKYLRAGAYSVFASTLLLLAYLVLNVEVTGALRVEHVDDMVMIGVVMFGFYTAVSLHDAARIAKLADRRRKLAEEDAQKHRQWLNDLVKQMPIGVAVVARGNGELVLTNDHFDRVLRPRPDGSEAFNHRTLKLYDRDGTALDISNWPSRRALFTRRATRDEEVLVERSDGSRIWLAVSSVPVEDTTRPEPTAIITFSDITDRKRAEEERAALVRGVLHAQENERLRIARELHDELGQDLVGLSVLLK